MCNNHSYEEPPWVAEFLKDWDAKGYLQPVRCLPGFGIHEHCDHVKPAPNFKDVKVVFDRV